MTIAEMLFGAVSFLSSIIIILGGFVMKGLIRRVCKAEEDIEEIKDNYIGRFESLTKVVTDNKDEVKDLINANHLTLLNAIHEIK